MAHHVSGLMSFATNRATVRQEKHLQIAYKLSKPILPQSISADKGKIEKVLISKYMIAGFLRNVSKFTRNSNKPKERLGPVITKDSKIIDVIQEFPEATSVFKRFGMGCVGCMGMISETIEDGAKMHRISIDKLLYELNKIGYK